MGLTISLREAFSFVYRAEVDNGMIEHEHDHVLLGRFEGTPHPHPHEVEAWRWADPKTLNQDVTAHPERYTVWFRLCFERVLEASPPHPNPLPPQGYGPGTSFTA
jgi:isopentenyl-diphosphate delta-isomerase